MSDRRWNPHCAPPAARAILALGLALSLAIGCSQQTPEAPEPASEAATTVVPPATAEPGTAARDVAIASPGTAKAGPVPSALEPAPDARPDPDLTIGAGTPGQATARWGSSGPDVGGKSPWRSLANDGIHARDSGAIGLLQEPQSALSSLPRGRSGNLIDWAAALNDGVVRPRARVGSQGQMEVLDLDIVLADTKNMPVVTFPHRTHTEWLGCKNCHDWLFKAQKGANNIAMTDIARGRACGLCHGKVSFPATDCFRCHNGPRPQG
jgi:c(7)-type cytochrome triheme protein